MSVPAKLPAAAVKLPVPPTIVCVCCRLTLTMQLLGSILRSDMAYAAVNGLRLYYEVHGAGPPMLSLHGEAGSINSDLTVIPFLATQFRVIAIEQMGRGRTADVIDRPFH